MKQTTKRVVLLLSALLIALSLFVLCACTIKPEKPNDTDKRKLTVTFDDSHTVYEGDSLDSIKPYITVTYTDKDGKDSVVTNYTLSGTIAKGESNITVKYDNLTYTLDITVSKKRRRCPRRIP